MGAMQSLRDIVTKSWGKYAVGLVSLPVMYFSVDKALENMGYVNAGSAYAAEASPIPDQIKLKSLFNGEFYETKTPQYPKGRLNPMKALNRREGDLQELFKDQSFLKYFGNQVQDYFNNESLRGVAYDPNNTKEVAFAFKLNGKLYHGFLPVDSKMMSIVQEHNK